MARIHNLKISHFRGLDSFSCNFYRSNFVCLIGRGDSGKSTILAAIGFALTPNRTVQFYDSDFHKCDISQPIEIEVSVCDLPKSLVTENKFGLLIQGIDKDSGELCDDVMDSHEPAITVRLRVDEDLEPHWHVVNGRGGEKEMSSASRAELNVYVVADYIDRHFSWQKGSPLYTLLNREREQDSVGDENVVIDALRKAKNQIDSNKFESLDNALGRVIAAASSFGIDIRTAATTVDYRDLMGSDGKISLHDEGIPFRMKGKSSRRIISIAIQSQLTRTGGLLLVDEVEQGLEPDRAQHLVNTLKRGIERQTFVSTHSRDVLVELQASDLFLIRKSEGAPQRFDKAIQGCLRQNPEAFFSTGVVVCEGPTEIGIVRAIDEWHSKQEKPTAALKGIRFADGTGSKMIEYAKEFKRVGYRTALFCDSNDRSMNIKKTDVRDAGVTIIDCEDDFEIEDQVFKDLPLEGLRELVEYVGKDRVEDAVTSVYVQKKEDKPDNWFETDAARGILAQAAKGGHWFKRIDHGEFLGKKCVSFLDKIGDTRLGSILTQLSCWIIEDA